MRSASHVILMSCVQEKPKSSSDSLALLLITHQQNTSAPEAQRPTQQSKMSIGQEKYQTASRRWNVLVPDASCTVAKKMKLWRLWSRVERQKKYNMRRDQSRIQIHWCGNHTWFRWGDAIRIMPDCYYCWKCMKYVQITPERMAVVKQTAT